MTPWFFATNTEILVSASGGNRVPENIRMGNRGFSLCTAFEKNQAIASRHVVVHDQSIEVCALDQVLGPLSIRLTYCLKPV